MDNFKCPNCSTKNRDFSSINLLCNSCEVFWDAVFEELEYVASGTPSEIAAEIDALTAARPIQIRCKITNQRLVKHKNGIDVLGCRLSMHTRQAA